MINVTVSWKTSVALSHFLYTETRVIRVHVYLSFLNWKGIYQRGKDGPSTKCRLGRFSLIQSPIYPIAVKVNSSMKLINSNPCKMCAQPFAETITSSLFFFVGILNNVWHPLLSLKFILSYESSNLKFFMYKLNDKIHWPLIKFNDITHNTLDLLCIHWHSLRGT